jgi:hypothetical protein
MGGPDEWLASQLNACRRCADSGRTLQAARVTVEYANTVRRCQWDCSGSAVAKGAPACSVRDDGSVEVVSHADYGQYLADIEEPAQ